LSESVKPHDERIGTLPYCHLERRPEIISRSHVQKLGLDTKRSRRHLNLFLLRWQSWVPHVEEDRDSCGSPNHLPEDLDPLGVCLCNGGAQARDISARVGKVGDKALPYRIAQPPPTLQDRPTPVMTTGIILVAFLAARAAGVPLVRIRSTLEPNRLSCQARETLIAALG
jgi:hypothetical protein